MRYGPTPLQKLYTVIQILGYGHAADHMEREARVSETCAFECVREFSEWIVETHGYRWMELWRDAAIKNELKINVKRGFPGMMGSIDCIHWEWKLYTVAWQEMYQGYKGQAQ